MQFEGAALGGIPTHRRVSLGIGYMPEDRRLVPRLSVEENVLLPTWSAGMPDRAARQAGIYRAIPEIEEFRIETMQQRALTELRLTLEPGPECTSTTGLAERVAQKFRESIGLRPQVELVSPGTLPRFELKAKRFFKL